MFYRALLFGIIFSGCLDYQEALIAGAEGVNYYPIINKDYIRPDPTITDKMYFGVNCKPQFTIPPIKDLNRADRLYYLWFFDKHLLGSTRTIEPENRNTAIITFSLTREIIETHLAQTLDAAFFERRHVLHFFVADRPYSIPESRYNEEEALEDSVYWNLSFSDTTC